MRAWFHWDNLLLFVPFAAALLSAIAAYVWPRTLRVIAWLWVIVILAVVFSPALSTIAWHVRYGNHIEFQGKRFHVPARWTATLGNGIDFKKDSFSLFPGIFGGGLEVMWITPSNRTTAQGPADQRVQTWRQNMQTMNNRFGNARVLVSLPSGSHDLECVRSLFGVSCLFVQSGWTAEYLGSEEDQETFLEILRSSQ